MTPPRAPTAPCGPLDVDDAAPIPTHRIADELIRAALDAAVTSDAFDGEAAGPSPQGALAPTWVLGPTTVAKVQHRAHERLASLLWFERARVHSDLPVPALLDHGEVGPPATRAWWIVLERSRGHEAPPVTPRRQAALARTLAHLHDRVRPEGLRLDDRGAVGVYLGTARAVLADLAHHLARDLDAICQGSPMVAVHGDVAVTHNSLFAADEVDAVIDPGAIHIAPRELDLAWAFAVDLPRGGTLGDLLDAYPANFDLDLLEALLPTILVRRLVDLYLLDEPGQAQRLSDEIELRSPGLLAAHALTRDPWHDHA